MNERCYCIKCGDDYLPHQTIIAEVERKRCICLNCWAVLQKLERTVNKKTNIIDLDEHPNLTIKEQVCETISKKCEVSLYAAHMIYSNYDILKEIINEVENFETCDDCGMFYQECDCTVSCSSCGGECIREEDCPENWVCQDPDCEVHKNE